MLILGTDGYIEVRKYIDIARTPSGNQVYVVNRDGERLYDATCRTGYPFFGRFILDCLNGTEHAMTQKQAVRFEG